MGGMCLRSVYTVTLTGAVCELNNPLKHPSVETRENALAFALVGVLASMTLLPQLANPVWQDEAATLMVFASGSFTDAFTNYSMPNNHPLFSAILSLLWTRGDSGLALRLLPLLSWLATLTLLATALPRFAAGARLCGLALFSASAVTAAFALQLRGYAMSWPFALLLCRAAPTFVIHARPTAGLLCVLWCFALVAIVPSNALVGAVCGGWMLLITLWLRPTSRLMWVRAVGVALLPLIALSIYLPHFEQLRHHANSGLSSWPDAALISHWLLASSAQFVPLLPLFLIGGWLGVRRRRVPDALADDHAGLLLGAALVSVVVAVVLLPVALFPRLLVPLLPLWCLALGALMRRSWRAFSESRQRLPRSVGLIALLAVYLIAQRLPACGGFWPQEIARADLCQQFYRQDYRPRAAYDFLHQQPGAAAQAVMLDSEAAWAFGFLAWNGAGSALNLVEYRAWRNATPAREPPAFVVTRKQGDFIHLLQSANLSEPQRAQRIFAQGFFEIWHLYWD